MKKIILSAAVAAMAFSTSAMAADKGIDIVTNGQAVVYYQTVDTDGANTSFFDEANSNANVGIQLDLGADLGNNFTFGAQLTYIDALGLNKNLVGDTRVMQVGGSLPSTQALGGNNTSDDLALTKIFIAKKIGNTTLKIGRQELPKSLSPLAFSEGWNVFKNTFEAVVAINTDIPNTTIVAAYVGGSTGANLTTMDDMTAKIGATAATVALTEAAYMLTAQTTVIPMTTLTASYYSIAASTADAYWIDAQIGKDLPMGLTFGAQYGNLDPDGFDDTTAWGVKVSAKPIEALSVTAAYSDVNDGALAMRNLGTGIKTPLYTQMIGNQDYIAHDNDTMMLQLSYSLGEMGTIILQGTDTDDNSAVDEDVTDIEVAYKLNAGGVNYFAGYVNRDKTVAADDQIVRIWARYNF